MTNTNTFPAPLEVDRYLYLPLLENDASVEEMIPSPLEVDRYLYLKY